MEHTEQVLAMAETFQERVAAICHDVGKATEPWQARARANFHYADGTPIPSPHPHAEWGGVLAYFILEGLDADLVTRTAILHTVAAHHSELGPVETTSGIVAKIADSSEALEFALEAFASFLPEVTGDTIKKAWAKAREAFAYGEIESLFDDKDFTDSDKLNVVLSSRRMLAKLVFFDTRSAANQDQKTRREFTGLLPDSPYFTERPNRTYKQGRLSDLRNTLKAACLSMDESLFYSIEAPTGLGKTEAMLSLAEKIISAGSKHAVVYAVPQISICEQIVSDYMTGADAQVWNFKTKQKVGNGSNFNDQDTQAAVLESQFSSPYNITTFNQVVLSIAHPHRNHCVRSLWLKNAVIIMDEIHKLPVHCLLYFLPLAKLYAEQNNCTWILGSATPLPDSQKIFRGIQVVKIDQTISAIFKQTPMLYERRVYQRIEDQNAQSIADRIQSLVGQDDQNLVLLSLVEKGTFAVAKILDIPTDPWNRIFTGLNPEHPVVWLDGSVPPLLREHYLSYVKNRLIAKQSITLLTTQVVEAGVDLDFETGFTDLISLSSTLQRGGRVAREARPDGRSRTLYVFNLKTIGNDGGQVVERTTKEILDSIALDSVKLTEQAKQKVKLLLCNTQSRTRQYFNAWEINEVRKEVALLDENESITIQELKAIRDPLISDIVTLTIQGAQIGLTLQYLDTITRLYSDEPYGESVVLFENERTLRNLLEQYANQSLRAHQELAARRISIHRNVLTSLINEGFTEKEVEGWTDRTFIRANVA
jgi:CRISPR-associated endonuclease/helicase Cas3